MAEYRAIIYEKNFDEINIKKESDSITGFVNNILEKYFEERLLELNDKNFQMIKELSIKMNKPMAEMLNLCLDAVKFEYQEIEKPVVPIKKIKSNIKIKKQNPFTNY